jgi:uncharacterized protein YjiS (DUF1127 family)
MFHATFIRGQDHAPSVGVLALVQRAVSGIVSPWENRRQPAHAPELDDHLLADVGLTRENVTSARRFRSPLGFHR